jgi:hypothetical protein
MQGTTATRVARNFHDTFMQTVQASKMAVDEARNVLIIGSVCDPLSPRKNYGSGSARQLNKVGLRLIHCALPLLMSVN